MILRPSGKPDPSGKRAVWVVSMYDLVYDPRPRVLAAFHVRYFVRIREFNRRHG